MVSKNMYENSEIDKMNSCIYVYVQKCNIWRSANCTFIYLVFTTGILTTARIFCQMVII